VPGDIHRVNHYSGTVTVHVDRVTGAALATPAESPMTITRVTESVSGATGADTTVVRDTDTIDALGQTQVQSNNFVLDRRTVRNLNDARAFAFGSTQVDRGAAFYPTLPFSVDNKRTYQIWNNEAGVPYPMRRAEGAATTTTNGLRVLRMHAVLPTTPVASYYVPELTELGLPSSLTPEQLQAQLQAAGVNVAAVADGLAKVLSADEMTTIIGTLANPLPLQYSTSLDADGLVEPTTGIVVSTHSVKRFFVGPDPSAFTQVKAILNRHSSDPFVKGVSDNLIGLVATPKPAFTLDYRTDPASVASMAKYADDQRTKVRLATLYLPAGLLLLAVILLFSAWLAWRKAQSQSPSRFIDLREVREPTPDRQRKREPAGV
jgi:Porin PorA